MKNLIIIVAVIILIIIGITVFTNGTESKFTVEEIYSEQAWLNSQINKVHLDRDEFYLYKDGEIYKKEIELKKGKNTHVFESGIETKRGIKSGSTIEQFADAYGNIPHTMAVNPSEVLYEVIRDCYDYDEKKEEYKKYEPYYIGFKSQFQNSIYVPFSDSNKVEDHEVTTSINSEQSQIIEQYALMFIIENDEVVAVMIGYHKEVNGERVN